jgi:hypothetical protein
MTWHFHIILQIVVDKNPFGCALLCLKKGPHSIPCLFLTRVIFQSVKRLAPNCQGCYKSCKSSVACVKVLQGACNLYNFKLLRTGSSNWKETVARKSVSWEKMYSLQILTLIYYKAVLSVQTHLSNGLKKKHFLLRTQHYDYINLLVCRKSFHVYCWETTCKSIDFCCRMLLATDLVMAKLLLPARGKPWHTCTLSCLSFILPLDMMC